MAQWIEVIPAYGREYTTAKAARADWNADLDFQETVSGSYVNKSGAKALDLSVTLRFCNLTKVAATK